MFRVKIDTRRATLLEKEPITSGSVGLLVKFEFSEDWEGLTKTAVFSDGICRPRSKFISSDIVEIAPEAMRYPYRTLTVGIYGTDGESIAIPTIYCQLGEILKGADPSCDPSLPFTPTVEQQLASRITDHEERITILEEEIKQPYLSFERLNRFLYRVTFKTLSEDNDETGAIPPMCSSYVKNGKLYRNLDWNYDNDASFHVVCSGFEGMSFIDGLTDEELSYSLISKLPYRIVDGKNDNGIMVSTHVLYNDWGFQGSGTIPLTRLSYLVLTNVKSMDTIHEDLGDILDNLVVPSAMATMEYLIQVLVTDGTTSYVLRPNVNTETYEAINITENPKLSNFLWTSKGIVDRSELQTRPTGVERWNMMPCDLKDLRFTKAYEEPSRLSEFIGLNGTTKDSTDAELEAIYETAHEMYQNRTRDGSLWQTMHSVVYSPNGIEHLWIQENWNKDYINSSSDSSEKTYIHTQYNAETLWIVEHNLGKYPSVTVVDSAGTKVHGNVQYIDQNKITLQFSQPFSGKAYLN